MNQRIDERLTAATESAVGRFVYKFIMPATFALVGWFGVRAINSLDSSIDKLQTASETQGKTQTQIKADIAAVRAQMNYQTKYQELVDAQQNEELERHARALHLK